MKIILLTGLSGSGKTSIGEILEKQGCGLIRVQKLLHNWAVELGYERIRHWLARVGEDHVLFTSRCLILKEILKKGNLDVVVDDCFDPDLPDIVKRVFPKVEVVTIWIKVDENTREARIAGRLGVEIGSRQLKDEVTLLDNFKKKAGIEAVIQDANIVIENGGKLDETVGELETMIGRGIKGKER